MPDRPLPGLASRSGKTISLLTNDRARFVVFCCFIALVALTGGSSRPDIPSLVILRPAAVLFAVYAMVLATGDQLRAARGPLLVILAWMLLALLQLVPLPNGLWSALPGRQTVAEAAALMGVEGQSRPLSLVPGRTWNTFFALFVPLAAIGMVAVQSPSYRRMAIHVLVAAGLISAVVGVTQALAGGGIAFYQISHRGYPVGLFANKNHQAVLLLWLMITACFIAATTDPRRFSASAIAGGAMGALLVLFPLMILTGSRAGLVLGLPTLALCAWLLFRGAAMKALLARAKRARLLVSAIVALMVAPLLLVFVALALSGRHTALSRLFELQAAEDLRSTYLPIFAEMTTDYLPLGAGFGSFEKLFNAYEPAQLLTSRYMNQAHNEPMQLLIEGGLPALAIVLAALAWLVVACWRLFVGQGRDGKLAAAYFGGSIVLWLAAGLVDYPLRTPLAAALVAALTAQLSFLSKAANSRPVSLGNPAAQQGFAPSRIGAA